MTRTLPLHRRSDDARMRYRVVRNRMEADGIDLDEALALLVIVETDVLPTSELMSESLACVTSIGLSPDGVRGQRPQRLTRTAIRRIHSVTPFPASDELPPAA